MQEPVYVLHLITCHGRIMPRLAELLLLLFFTENKSWQMIHMKYQDVFFLKNKKIKITVFTICIWIDRTEQRVKTEVRYRIMRHLTSVFTVCHSDTTSGSKLYLFKF